MEVGGYRIFNGVIVTERNESLELKLGILKNLSSPIGQMIW